MPKDEGIRRDIVKTYHDSLPAGHPGRWKTYELVSRNYWWPGMSSFVEKYVSGCDTCVRTKNSNRKPMGLLKPNEAPRGPWQSITCDFIHQYQPAALIKHDNLSFSDLIFIADKDFPRWGQAEGLDAAWRSLGNPGSLTG